MIKKLRINFIITTMVIVAIVLSLLLGFIVMSTRKSIIQDSVNMMRNIAMEPRKPGSPGENVPDVHIPYFTISYDQDGNLDTTGGYYDLSDEELLKELYEIADSSEEEQGVIEQYNFRFLKMHTPKGQIIVFADTSNEESIISGILKTCILIFIAAMVAFFFISLLLSKFVVKPVEKAWNQQKQFIANASHDLKTPLTVILADAEMLQSEKVDTDKRLKLSGAISAMATQMKGLVTSMLDLTRVEDDSNTFIKTEVNLSKVVNNEVLKLEPVFYEKGLTISTEVDDGIKLMGNESELSNLLEILLDNASKYCKTNSETVVKLKKQGSNILLSIADFGEEIPKEERENIFKRFYRADKTRAMNHSYGLGLSIAQKIVENHKGKIWCESEDGLNKFFVKI